MLALKFVQQWSALCSLYLMMKMTSKTDVNLEGNYFPKFIGLYTDLSVPLFDQFQRVAALRLVENFTSPCRYTPPRKSSATNLNSEIFQNLPNFQKFKKIQTIGNLRCGFRYVMHSSFFSISSHIKAKIIFIFCI